ncbi:MAG: hypothetical protein ACREP7_05340, partial [Lysobacter sp.]
VIAASGTRNEEGRSEIIAGSGDGGRVSAIMRQSARQAMCLKCLLPRREPAAARGDGRRCADYGTGWKFG